MPPFIRQLFWVYYSFIALCLVSFSIITIAFADTLAAGGDLARALCAFFALFWTLRLIAGTFVFDMRPHTGSSQKDPPYATNSRGTRLRRPSDSIVRRW